MQRQEDKQQEIDEIELRASFQTIVDSDSIKDQDLLTKFHKANEINILDVVKQYLAAYTKESENYFYQRLYNLTLNEKHLLFPWLDIHYQQHRAKEKPIYFTGLLKPLKNQEEEKASADYTFQDCELIAFLYNQRLSPKLKHFSYHPKRALLYTEKARELRGEKHLSGWVENQYFDLDSNIYSAVRDQHARDAKQDERKMQFNKLIRNLDPVGMCFAPSFETIFSSIKSGGMIAFAGLHASSVYSTLVFFMESDEENKTLMMSLLKEAISTGNATALTLYGQLYFEGEQVEIDYEKAKQFLLAAAEHQQADAYFYLGKIHAASHEAEAAIHYYTKAVELGHSLARSDLDYVASIDDKVFNEKQKRQDIKDLNNPHFGEIYALLTGNNLEPLNRRLPLEQREKIRNQFSWARYLSTESIAQAAYTVFKSHQLFGNYATRYYYYNLVKKALNFRKIELFTEGEDLESLEKIFPSKKVRQSILKHKEKRLSHCFFALREKIHVKALVNIVMEYASPDDYLKSAEFASYSIKKK